MVQMLRGICGAQGIYYLSIYFNLLFINHSFTPQKIANLTTDLICSFLWATLVIRTSVSQARARDPSQMPCNINIVNPLLPSLRTTTASCSTPASAAPTWASSPSSSSQSRSPSGTPRSYSSPACATTPWPSAAPSSSPPTAPSSMTSSKETQIWKVSYTVQLYLDTSVQGDHGGLALTPDSGPM